MRGTGNSAGDKEGHSQEIRIRKGRDIRMLINSQDIKIRKGQDIRREIARILG